MMAVQGRGRARGQGNNSPGGEASKVTTQRWRWQERAAATWEGNCHPRPGTHTLQCLGVSTCNRGWKPGAESGRRWRRVSHTGQTRTPARPPSWLCSPRRRGRGVEPGAGRGAESCVARQLPLSLLPLQFILVPEINLRWRGLGKPYWTLETVRLRGSPSWVMAKMPSQCLTHVVEISIPER